MSDELKFDKKTAEWMSKHPKIEITVCRCEICGVFYAGDLGHHCLLDYSSMTDAECIETLWAMIEKMNPGEQRESIIRGAKAMEQKNAYQCKDCLWEKKGALEDPCCRCKRNMQDKWELNI